MSMLRWHEPVLPVIKSPRFFENCSRADLFLSVGYSTVSLHDHIFRSEEEGPRGEIQVFAKNDYGIFRFWQIFTWPSTTGFLPILWI